MNENTIVQHTPDHSYVDWAAIFAGAVISSGVAIVLTTFAAGLGLGSISIDDGGEISLTWMIITALFVILSMLAANMLGGYISGRMRRQVNAASSEEISVRDGLHGLVVWALGIIISGILAVGAISGTVKAVGSAAEITGSVVGGTVQSAGSLAGGLISATGSAVSGAGQAAAPSLKKMLPEGMQNNPLDYITDTLFRTNNQSFNAQSGLNESNSAQAQRQISRVFSNILHTGEVSDADKSWISAEIANRTNLTQSEAQARVDQAVGKVQSIREEAEKKLSETKAQLEQAITEAKAQAADAAEKARIAAILSAFLLAASALVAAVAAYIGAIHGGRHRDEGRIWGGLAYRR